MNHLMAGHGRECITPPAHVYMMGYGARNEPSVGIHDDLFANAVALSDGEQRVVVVALDVCEMDVNCVQVLKGIIGEVNELEPAEIIINTSHSHAGPMVCPGPYSRFEARYAGAMAVRAAQAVAEALADMRQAKLLVGSAPLDIGASRRQVLPDGMMTIGVDLNRPRLPEVTTWFLRREQAPGILLWSAPLHGATVTGDNLWISSEWMGSAVRQFEALQPDVKAIFLQGCCGDQNPYREQHSFEQLEAHGAAAARALEQALEASTAVKNLPLRSLERTIDLPTSGGGVFPCPLRALRLGGAVFVAMGAEPFVEYALYLRALGGPASLMVLGYTDATVGYIPTAAAFAEGGYEPNSFGWFSQGQKLEPTCEAVTKQALAQALADITK
ncbi:MAG: neutral/alkaline non-lysosomal ceramidase N-terminal domain-containing protein [Chloroflexi bacterium]|nr:neutral/alkaline non-lysosomal ceramidase N-terminal domain-containing protein [Chloroflexota bacterium]